MSPHAVRPLVGLGLLLLSACRQSFGSGDDIPQSFNQADVAGFYAIHQVEGHDIPWYHQIGGVNCQVAFSSGGLDIDPVSGFTLDLDYNYRCVDGDPPDGSGSIFVRGAIRYYLKGTYALAGTGPNLIAPQAGFDDWFMTVKPDGDFLEFKFTGVYGDYMGNPVLTLGPRTGAVTR